MSLQMPSEVPWVVVIDNLLPGPSHHQHRRNPRRGRDFMGLRAQDHRLPRLHGRLCCYERSVCCHAAGPEAGPHRGRGRSVAGELLGGD